MAAAEGLDAAAELLLADVRGARLEKAAGKLRKRGQATRGLEAFLVLEAHAELVFPAEREGGDAQSDGEDEDACMGVASCTPTLSKSGALSRALKDAQKELAGASDDDRLLLCAAIARVLVATGEMAAALDGPLGPDGVPQSRIRETLAAVPSASTRLAHYAALWTCFCRGLALESVGRTVDALVPYADATGHARRTSADAGGAMRARGTRHAACLAVLRYGGACVRLARRPAALVRVSSEGHLPRGPLRASPAALGAVDDAEDALLRARTADESLGGVAPNPEMAGGGALGRAAEKDQMGERERNKQSSPKIAERPALPGHEALSPDADRLGRQLLFDAAVALRTYAAVAPAAVLGVRRQAAALGAYACVVEGRLGRGTHRALFPPEQTQHVARQLWSAPAFCPEDAAEDAVLAAALSLGLRPATDRAAGSSLPGVVALLGRQGAHGPALAAARAALAQSASAPGGADAAGLLLLAASAAGAHDEAYVAGSQYVALGGCERDVLAVHARTCVLLAGKSAEALSAARHAGSPFLEAAALVSRGDYVSALSLMRRCATGSNSHPRDASDAALIGTLPNGADSHVRTGTCGSAGAMPPDSTGDADAESRPHPTRDARMSVLAGLAHALRGDYGEAEACVRDALGAAPELCAAWLLAALVFAAAGRAQAALGVCDAYLSEACGDSLPMAAVRAAILASPAVGAVDDAVAAAAALVGAVQRVVPAPGRGEAPPPGADSMALGAPPRGRVPAVQMPASAAGGDDAAGRAARLAAERFPEPGARTQLSLLAPGHEAFPEAVVSAGDLISAVRMAALWSCGDDAHCALSSAGAPLVRHWLWVLLGELLVRASDAAAARGDAEGAAQRLRDAAAAEAAAVSLAPLLPGACALRGLRLERSAGALPGALDAFLAGARLARGLPDADALPCLLGASRVRLAMARDSATDSAVLPPRGAPACAAEDPGCAAAAAALARARDALRAEPGCPAAACLAAESLAFLHARVRACPAGAPGALSAAAAEVEAALAAALEAEAAAGLPLPRACVRDLVLGSLLSL